MGAPARIDGRGFALAHARSRLAADPHAARSLVRRFSQDTGGATAIEYALIASLLSVLIVGGATSVGTKLSGFFTSMTTKW